jgi:uncharacterized membrane protein/Mg-chelatase subunit ChlD
MYWSISILEPLWLALLLAVPLLVWHSVDSLAALGPFRRWIAIGVRALVLLLLVLALADLQLVRRSDRRCTLFVLDQSLSVPDEWTERGLDVVSAAIRGRARDTDQVGMVVFGKDARLELPPDEYRRDRVVRNVGSLIDREYSDLASGIKLALGSLPPDSAGRVVLISDGNQNRGNVLAQALATRQQEVPIDVLPIEYRYDSEIMVDRVVLPPNLKKGDTANLRIVIRSARPASGKIRLNRVAEGETRAVHQQDVVLREGLNVFFLKQSIDEPDFYTYEAHFEPDPTANDRLARNNRASAFTWVRGEGRVLLIEANGGEHRHLVDRLRQDNISVVTRTPDQIRPWNSLAELRQFDTVILANVPAEELGERLQELIAANTRELGAGLIMIGGPDSFGAGGYIGTPIEKALPVDMEIKSTKIRTKGALVLTMHACEIPEGNYWQKKLAKLAIQTLGSKDECGLVAWNGTTSWIFALQEVGDRSRMLRRIDQMSPGDMPDFESSMQLALNALLKSQASTKHMIIISDGDPQPPSPAILQNLKDAKITCSAVAVAAHGPAEQQVMRNIAKATGGTFHNVTNPARLPQIYIKETRVVSRPLIFEQKPPWQPNLMLETEPVAGMPKLLPAIQGFVLTTPKPTSQVPIVSPIPGEAEINPILAHWQFGLGKAVAFTSDVGQRWAVGWTGLPVFTKFWSQVVRWTMRTAESEELTVATQEKDGKATIVVNALDKSSEFLNLLPLEGTLIRPNLAGETLALKQTEPGKYEATFDAEQYGAYFLRIGYQRPDGGQVFVSTGLNVPYPPEYRDVASNADLLENVASLSGGRVLSWDNIAQADFFPPVATMPLRLRSAWPVLLLAALCTFLFDVAVRRIAIDPRDVAQIAAVAWARLRHQPAPVTVVTMERLRAKKAQVDAELDIGRRFEIDLTKPPPTCVLDSTAEAAAPKPPVQPASKPQTLAPGKDQAPASYTSRLLEAKKKAWQDRRSNE